MKNKDDKRKCRTLALAQYGLITRRQALDAGMTPRAIDWQLERGNWHRVHPQVYVYDGGGQVMGTVVARGMPMGRDPNSGVPSLCGCSLGAGEHGALGNRDQHPSLPSVMERCCSSSHGGRNPGGSRKEKGHTADRRRSDTLRLGRSDPVTSPRGRLRRCVESTAHDAPFSRVYGQRPGAQRQAWLRSAQKADRVAIRTRCDPRKRARDKASGLLQAAHVPLPISQYEIRDAGRFVARVDFAYPDFEL